MTVSDITVVSLLSFVQLFNLFYRTVAVMKKIDAA